MPLHCARSVALAAFFSLLATACNSNSSTASPVGGTVTDIAGEYTGSFQDSVAGTQTVSTSTLAQHGSAVGGSLAMPVGNESVAWTIDAGNNVSGSGSLDVASAKCVFSMSAAYNTSTNQLSGTYTAVSGCSGRNGTFALTQTCSEPVTGYRRRSESIPARC